MSGECTQCAPAKCAAYRKRNPDKVKKWKRDWDKRNPEKTNQMWKIHYWADPEHRERHAIQVRNWTTKNRGKKAAIECKRRAAKLHSMPPWADLNAIEAVYLDAAAQRRLGFAVHVDHIIPLQGDTVCGLHVHNNLQVLAARDNCIKHNFFAGEIK